MLEVQPIKMPTFGALQGANSKQFLEYMQRALHQSIDPMVAEVRAGTTYSSVASKYSILDKEYPDGVGVEVRNSSSAWLWVEKGAKQHWPSRNADGRLVFWARMKGIRNVSRLAAAISVKAHPGNQLYKTTSEKYLPKIQYEIRRAGVMWVRTKMGIRV